MRKLVLASVSLLMMSLFVIPSVGIAGDTIISSKNWIYEGPIYEVNLDRYPNQKYTDLTQRVPQLKELGIKTIYLMPIWECVEDKPYSIYNYSLNPKYGSEDDFHNLIDTIHCNGMKIIVDIVISYAPPGSYIYKKDWMLHYKPEYGKGVYFWRWEPSTDQTNPDLIEYLSDTAKYYVKNYDIDGWRVDAPQLNFNMSDFNKIQEVSPEYNAVNLLRRMKEKITNVKPEALLLTELPGPLSEGNSEAEPLFDEVSEISYSWELTGLLRPKLALFLSEEAKGKIREIRRRPDFLEHTEEYSKEIYEILNSDLGTHITSDEDFRKALAQYGGIFPGFVQKMITGDATSQDLVNFFSQEQILYNRTRARWVENHDSKVRLEAAFPEQHKELVVLISTIPGVPMIFAGQEIGARISKQSPDWDHGDYQLREFYKKVFRIRSQNAPLKYGDIRNVWKSGDNTYAYVRSYKDEKVVVILNFQDEKVSSALDLSFWSSGAKIYDELNDEEFIVDSPKDFQVIIPAYGARILVLQK